MEPKPILPLQNAPSRWTACPLLYQEQGLLIIDKPEGVLSHPNTSTSKSSKHAAFEGAYDFENRCFTTPGGPVWLLHRLDQDTSGVLIAAQSVALTKKLRKLFDENEIHKTYLVLVMGLVRPPQGAWKDCMLTQQSSGRVRSRIIKSGAPNAELDYKIYRVYPNTRLTLLEIKLITGRTHQIRVQSSYRGYPVVGDDIYGHFGFNKKIRRELGLKRMVLHASRVQFRHPESGKIISVTAPLPEELQNFLPLLS